MNRKLRTIVLAAIALMSVAAAQAFTVVVRSSSGNQNYQTGNVSSIQFTTEGGATINLADGQQVYVSASEFQSLGFNSDSGISDATAPLAFTVENGIIYSGDGGHISVYDISGRECGSSQSGVLDISAFANGAYIVKTSATTTKILLR